MGTRVLEGPGVYESVRGLWGTRVLEGRVLDPGWDER